jgi:pyruvate dehydrogenase E1 component beta subunit
MAVSTFRDALRQALAEEMERDPNVFVIGEEVAQYEGTFRVTEGLLKQFGEQRVVDTPISEEGFTGLAVGAAMAGLRPVVEYMTINFGIRAMDQIVNHAAKMHYMSGGQYKVPMVIRGPGGPGVMLSAQHSQALEAWFVHVPGLKVVAPSTPADAKGMLKAAIRDDNTVIFMEHAALYNVKGEIPEGDYVVPIGKAELRRPGRDVTIVSYLRGMTLALGAAVKLADEGIEAEVIDLRSLLPLDMETVLASVRRTHRCVIVAEDTRTGSMSSEIAVRIGEEAFDDLDAPVERVTGEDVPMPYARNLELLAVPDEAAVVAAARRTVWREGFRPPQPALAGTKGSQETIDGRSDHAKDGRRDGGGHPAGVAQERR